MRTSSSSLRSPSMALLVVMAVLFTGFSMVPAVATEVPESMDAAVEGPIRVEMSDDPLSQLETCSYTQPADASGYGFIRISGNTRYDTAVDASREGFPDGAPAVVIATGKSWPDALGGAALAGTLRAPILLTKPTELPMPVLYEIQRLEATKAYILGGPGAVSVGVQQILSDELGPTNVIRIGGTDRYETADMIARKVFELNGSEDWAKTVFFATGSNFPDALAASPVSWALKAPILLVPRGATEPRAGSKEFLNDALPNQAFVLGGTSAVTEALETYVDARIGPGSVVRLAGTDRYGTSVEVADYATTKLMFRWRTIGIATGGNFPDALAGGSTLGVWRAPLLLTRSNSVPESVKTCLQDEGYNPLTNPEGITTVAAFGGEGALSPAVEGAVKSYCLLWN